MTATPILETLAREFDTSVENVQNALEMVDAGLSAPFVGRFRRANVGGLPESYLRRLDRRRHELDELDRRRGTILRLLERDEGLAPDALDPIRACMDRFELEDLFIPHRRPEPEVQLALDRGLGALADELVMPVPKSERPPRDDEASSDDVDDAAADADSAQNEQARTGASDAAEDAAPEVPLDAVPEAADDASAVPLTAADGGAGDTPAEASSEALSRNDEAASPAQAASGGSRTPDDAAHPHPHLDLRAVMSAHLARLCAPYVNPDRGIHTDSEALAGALRILSDRLGRNARLRGTVRKQMRRHGVLGVRATIDEGRAGRWKPLLKVRQPLRQLQGHRLLAIRQAQKERVLTTVIMLDPDKVLPKVRAALGRYTHPAHEEVLDEVARQALMERLLPMVEQDVRLELKERADSEALRFLSQHLRQILLTPPFGRRPVVGVDVNARGDWTLALMGVDGNPRPAAEGRTDKVEVGEKDVATLGAEIAAWLGDARPEAWAIGHGKGPRAALAKLRAALAAADRGGFVFMVNESGLSSAANSEAARQELGSWTVPERCAIALGRRLQDPLAEILKVDPRHLGLGSEQGLVSKANARRAFDETIESSVAHVGCDVNSAPVTVLERVPGLDKETVAKIVARRATRSFASREELRQEGLLSEAQWASAIAFLRVPGSSGSLDATGLHPEQYPLVQRILESAGTTIEEGLGRMGSTRGLRRVDFDVDEATWRDLMREIGHPGRDPRPRLNAPHLLEAETDPARLVKDRVVEGIITNVASFGAFVDIGLAHDAMIHISEISQRYVRDARELLSVGQSIQARILDASSQRLALSLKNLPRPERGGPRERDGRGRRGHQGERPGGGERGRGRERGRGERQQPNVRAAQTRRDGLGSSGGSGGGRGGSGGRSGGGGGGGGGGRGQGRAAGRPGDRGREEHVVLDKVEGIEKKSPAYSPFANFFKKREGPETGEEGA